MYGEIPCVRCLTPEEIAEAYEQNTGRLIVEEFVRMGKDPMAVPAVLCKKPRPLYLGKGCQRSGTQCGRAGRGCKNGIPDRIDQSAGKAGTTGASG